MPNDYHYNNGMPQRIETQSVNGSALPQPQGQQFGGPPQQGGDPGNGGYFASVGYADAYDPRIGNGALPTGVYGSQNRAYVGEMDPGMYVENRLNNMLDQNSLYMRVAGQRGRDEASSRGLLNSSIAAGASQRSAIDAALPVATSDAEGARGLQLANLGHLNERAIADLQARTQGAQIAAQLEATGMEVGGALQRQRENLAFEGEQRGLDRDWTNARDYWTQRYATNAAIQEYGARTRIDMQVQPAQYFQYLQQLAAEQPDIYTPEVVGGIMNTIYPVYEDMGMMFDDWWDQSGWGYW